MIDVQRGLTPRKGAVFRIAGTYVTGPDPGGSASLGIWIEVCLFRQKNLLMARPAVTVGMDWWRC